MSSPRLSGPSQMAAIIRVLQAAENAEDIDQDTMATAMGLSPKSPVTSPADKSPIDKKVAASLAEFKGKFLSRAAKSMRLPATAFSPASSTPTPN